jgi:hypothetical protein
MANKKVSQLVLKESPAVADLLYLISGGTGFKVTLQAIVDLVNANLVVDDVPTTLTKATTPTTPNSTGTAGEISWDQNYLYICVLANQWRRIALTTW